MTSYNVCNLWCVKNNVGISASRGDWFQEPLWVPTSVGAKAWLWNGRPFAYSITYYLLRWPNLAQVLWNSCHAEYTDSEDCVCVSIQSQYSENIFDYRGLHLWCGTRRCGGITILRSLTPEGIRKRTVFKNGNRSQVRFRLHFLLNCKRMHPGNIRWTLTNLSCKKSWQGKQVEVMVVNRQGDWNKGSRGIPAHTQNSETSVRRRRWVDGETEDILVLRIRQPFLISLFRTHTHALGSKTMSREWGVWWCWVWEGVRCSSRRRGPNDPRLSEVEYEQLD